MEEETDWSQISRNDQRSYINAQPHASGAVSEILEKYGWQFHVVGPCHHDMARPQVADRGTASDKEGSCE